MLRTGEKKWGKCCPVWISFSDGTDRVRVRVKPFSCVRLFVTPLDCSPPGSSSMGFFHSRILKQAAISFSRGSSSPRDQTCVSCVSCVGRWILYHCTIWEAPLARLPWRTSMYLLRLNLNAPFHGEIFPAHHHTHTHPSKIIAFLLSELCELIRNL